jgi:hypothetical protein
MVRRNVMESVASLERCSAAQTDELQIPAGRQQEKQRQRQEQRRKQKQKQKQVLRLRRRMTTKKRKQKLKSEGKSESEEILSLFQGFQLVESAGPVCFEEAGQASVCEDLSAGLALGAVVGLVVGVADALYGLAAGWAGLSEAAVDGHVAAEGGDLLGKVSGGLRVEAVDPEL